MKLLYINKNINLSKPIIDQLKKEGFDVDVLIESHPSAIDKSTVIHKVMNIFYRLFLNDKTYYIKKERLFFEKFAEKKLKNENYDITFIIRADMFSEKLIRTARKQSKKMVSYQWDGLEMYPRIFNYYKYFDRKLVFDKKDIINFPEHHLLPLTNFFHSEDQAAKYNEEIDFFYIGVGLEERIRWAYNIEKYVKKNFFTYKAILTIPEFRAESKTEFVSLQHEGISLEQNEKLASTARAIIDFKMESHNGASFRVFECLQKQKKLISNNYTLKDYDFYHPDNIFLTDFEDLSGLKEFLQKPYHQIERTIVEKYGIKNWLNYALDYGDYEPINLP